MVELRFHYRAVILSVTDTVFIVGKFIDLPLFELTKITINSTMWFLIA